MRTYRGPLRARRLMAAALPLVFLAACGTAATPAATTGQARPDPGAAAGRAAASASAGTAGQPRSGRGPRVARRRAARPARAAPAAKAGGTTVRGAPGCPMFPADNVWNTDISKLPVNPLSAAWMKSMDSATTYLHPDFGPDPGGYPYGIPYTIVTNAHPLVSIAFTYASQSDKGPYPFGADTSIEGGKNAGGDRHAIMVNSGTCRLYELWDARYSASNPTAGSGAIWNLRSNTLRPLDWTSADAAGLPILPGLLNYGQIRAAVRSGTPITHAIRFTAENTRSSFLWPARHEASSDSSPDLPPMGARFRLKASFRVSRFCDSAATAYCKDAKAVLREMQHYGLILADNGSNWFFGGSAFPRWPDALVSLLKGIPASAFQAVSESCLRVSRNSGEATAKPGCPIG
jgi:hypothetical protein